MCEKTVIQRDVIFGQPDVNHYAEDYQSLFLGGSIVAKVYSYKTTAQGILNNAIPDATIDVLFSWNRDENTCSIALVGPAKELTPSYYYHKKNTDVFGIRMQPGCPFELFGIHANEMINKKNEVTCCDEESLHFMEMLHQKDSLREKYDYAINALDNMLVVRQDTHSELACFIERLILNNAASCHFNLNKISDITGYTPYYLNKIFREHTGYTIGNFQKVIRFQSLLKRYESLEKNGQKPEQALLAVEQGYSDQAHMIRDLKRFSGETPVNLWKKYYQ